MALQLTVVTPEGQAYEGEVEQVVLPGSEGDFGVLEQHERFLAALRPGALEIHTPGSGTLWAAMSDGFADVNAELVTVLVSRCDLAADIDTAETQSEIEAAEAGLRELGSAEEDAHARSEFESAIGAARLRLDVAGRS
jgi:F-type H+-transporting ATPase subunit epsilon